MRVAIGRNGLTVVESVTLARLVKRQANIASRLDELIRIADIAVAQDNEIAVSDAIGESNSLTVEYNTILREIAYWHRLASGRINRQTTRKMTPEEAAHYRQERRGERLASVWDDDGRHIADDDY